MWIRHTKKDKKFINYDYGNKQKKLEETTVTHNQMLKKKKKKRHEKITKNKISQGLNAKQRTN